jgi:hypothetical protein
MYRARPPARARGASKRAEPDDDRDHQKADEHRPREQVQGSEAQDRVGKRNEAEAELYRHRKIVRTS